MDLKDAAVVAFVGGLLILGCQEVLSQDSDSGFVDVVESAPATLSIEEGYLFDDWPGRDGALVAGFKLESLLHDLSFSQSTQLTRDAMYLSISEEPPNSTVSRFLTFRFTDEADSYIDLNICVGQKSVMAAHKELLAWFSSKAAPISEPVSFGRDLGITLGNFNFPVIERDSGKVTSIDFARGNIAIHISSHGTRKQDVLSDARRIDNQILGSPQFEDLEESRLMPAIEDVDVRPEQVAPGETATIRIRVRLLSAESPENVKVLLGNFSLGEAKKMEQRWKIQFTAGAETGQGKVRILVVTNRLLADRVEVTIPIVEGEDE